MDEYQNQFGYRDPELGEKFVGLRNFVLDAIDPPKDVDQTFIEEYLKMAAYNIHKRFNQIETPKLYGILRQGYATIKVINDVRQINHYVDTVTALVVEHFKHVERQRVLVRERLINLVDHTSLGMVASQSRVDKTTEEIIKLFYPMSE